VARHLVAAGQVIDEDAELALAHAMTARRLASRIAVVREAVGLAAYAVGDWASAIAELRTYHRMSGLQTHVAVIADCERALGRPERAIDLFRSADRDALDKDGAIELLIVAAGARGDLGQHDAAVAMLQVRELTADETTEWAARLRYAYADALLAANRRDEAREWFSRAAAADEDNLTDAAERLLELDGVTIDDDTDDDDDDETVADPQADSAGNEPSDDVSSDEDEDDEDEDDDEEEEEEEGDEAVSGEPAAKVDFRTVEFVHLDEDPDAPYVPKADRVLEDVDAGIDQPAAAADSDERVDDERDDDERVDEVVAVEDEDMAADIKPQDEDFGDEGPKAPAATA
jgi:tetratricopeptide (TPR) repeat protein